MFARFRQSQRRLQVSLVETRRVDGKVRHEHVASLGSIETPTAIADRITFWQRVNDRLGKLSNRIDPAIQGKIRGDIHNRIPMVTVDEQRALQLENAKADERFWSGLHDMHASKADDQKGLVAITESAIAENRAGATKAAEHANSAKERRVRLEKGEDVPGGLGKPTDFEAILRKAGMTQSDIRHAQDFAELIRTDEELNQFVRERIEAGDRADRAKVRKLLRKRRATSA
jgi:hypothetical protein